MLRKQFNGAYPKARGPFADLGAELPIAAAVVATTALVDRSLGPHRWVAVGRSAACRPWQLAARAGWGESA